MNERVFKLVSKITLRMTVWFTSLWLICFFILPVIFLLIQAQQYLPEPVSQLLNKLVFLGAPENFSSNNFTDLVRLVPFWLIIVEFVAALYREGRRRYGWTLNGARITLISLSALYLLAALAFLVEKDRIALIVFTLVLYVVALGSYELHKLSLIGYHVLKSPRSMDRVDKEVLVTATDSQAER